MKYFRCFRFLVMFLVMTLLLIPFVSYAEGGKNLVIPLEDGTAIKTFTVADFPYSYSKESKKAVSLYKEALSKSSDSWHQIEKERKGYKETLNGGEYLYYGKLKDGRPNGMGVIMEMSWGGETLTPIYLGEFKEGNYSGYGIEYDVDEYNAMPFQYVSFEGHYNKGKKDGDGVSYAPVFDVELKEWDKAYSIADEMKEYGLVHTHYVLYKGKYKDDKENGKGVMYYSDGTVMYEGNFKNNNFSGKGKLYFRNGNLQYEGEFKNGVYNGKGKLYNEDGSVNYKGKFKDGDIK